MNVRWSLVPHDVPCYYTAVESGTDIYAGCLFCLAEGGDTYMVRDMQTGDALRFRDTQAALDYAGGLNEVIGFYDEHSLGEWTDCEETEDGYTVLQVPCARCPCLDSPFDQPVATWDIN